jgi:lysophospholipase L1-like esterase
MPRGKHAKQRQRPRLTLTGLVAVGAIVVLGSSLAVRATEPPVAANQAKIASSVRASSTTADAPSLERLIVFGHSMPAGRGASAVSQGYASLAAEGAGLVLVNLADGGTSAAAAARSLEGSPEIGPQDAVVIHTGMNDILRRGMRAAPEGRAALTSLLQGTARAGRRVVVLECQPASWRATPAGRNLQAAYEAWNRMIREQTAQWRDVELLDTCAEWDTARFVDDSQFHPNDAGHALIADELVTLLTDR